MQHKIFHQFLPIICCYHGNILSGTIEKYILHIYTPRPKARICAKFHGNWAKTVKEVCNTRFSIISAHNVSCYHGNTPIVIVKKCVMLTYILKQTLNINYMRIDRRLLKFFAMKHFAIYFANTMPLPWQRTFCQYRNMCLSH